jgi:hypothetical protein
MRPTRSLFAGALAVAVTTVAALAQDDAAKPDSEAANPPAAETPSGAKRGPTPEELAEKEARKECKKKICDIIATRDPEGEDIACDIVKTWRE